MDAKHKDALRELEIAALRGHPDGYATSDCTVTYKEAADALRAALARIDELETALREYREKLVLLTADAGAEYSSTVFTRCPNSDELIAAIQQRFPGRLIVATHWPSGYTVINEVDPYTQQTTDGPLIAGDNPAHAWANKYLALAGGE